VAIYPANVQINIHSLYRIRTGPHNVEDLDGYLESNNAEDARISTYIQCLWHKVKWGPYLGVTASNTCTDTAMEQVSSASYPKSCIESTSKISYRILCRS